MHRGKTIGWRWFATVAVLTVLVGTVGCGVRGQYPVHGRVTYEDGSPLTEGTVIGEMGEGLSSVTVQGGVKSDGSFSWGTGREGDGAKPGNYRVIVMPRALSDAEQGQGMQPAVASKYTNPKTSGLTFEVVKGKNTLNITVSKPARRTAR